LNAGGMSQGQIVAVVSAVALVVSLFLAWGGAGGDIPDVSLPEGTPGAEAIEGQVDAAEDAAELTGWESQNTLDIYLAIIAAFVLGNVAMRFMGNPDGIPFAPPAATFLLSVIGAILTVYVLLDLPEGADPKIGLFVAIAAVIGVAVGSFLQMRDEVYEEGY
jgi:hypothetical protein